jgi:hypothetical protein
MLLWGFANSLTFDPFALANQPKANENTGFPNCLKTESWYSLRDYEF